MTRLDDLPPDQRAALSLLLRQRKSYAEVAGLLGIHGGAVHDRAHAALAVLAPRQARELPSVRREEIGDYLLGQQSDLAGRLRTRAFLEGSPQARAWAIAISAELAPIADAPLPEISGPTPPDPTPRAPATEAPRSSSPAHTPLPSSKRGGALLLGAIAAVVVVVVLLIATGGGSHKAARSSSTATKATTAPASATGTSGTTAKASAPTEDKRITLTSSDPTSKALGAAEVLSEGSKYAFYMAAEHLPPSKGFFYAVWLYNSPTSFQALGKSPNVGSNGKLQGGALLPANAAQYHKMLLTRETNSRPTRPGQIVLNGAFALH